MSYPLSQFLIDAYESRQLNTLHRKPYFDIPVQIDDQDDNDKLDDFCNIFITVKPKNQFKIELIGKFPITKELSDLALTHGGFSDPDQGKLVLILSAENIEIVLDLADKIRKTSFLGPIISNSNWLTISSRTISSLYRFVRIIKEYKSNSK